MNGKAARNTATNHARGRINSTKENNAKTPINRLSHVSKGPIGGTSRYGGMGDWNIASSLYTNARDAVLYDTSSHLRLVYASDFGQGRIVVIHAMKAGSK